jgi:hypothetical protein
MARLHTFLPDMVMSQRDTARELPRPAGRQVLSLATRFEI